MKSNIHSINVIGSNLIYNDNNDKLIFANVVDTDGQEKKYYIHTQEWIKLCKEIKLNPNNYKNIIDESSASIMENYVNNNAVVEETNTIRPVDFLIKYTEEDGTINLKRANNITEIIINKYVNDNNEIIEGISFTEKSKIPFKKDTQHVVYDELSCAILKKIALLKRLTNDDIKINGTNVPIELKMTTEQFSAIYPLQKYLNMENIYDFSKKDFKQINWIDEQENIQELKILEEYNNELLTLHGNIINNFIEKKDFANYIKPGDEIRSFFENASAKINNDLNKNNLNKDDLNKNNLNKDDLNKNNLNKDDLNKNNLNNNKAKVNKPQVASRNYTNKVTGIDIISTTSNLLEKLSDEYKKRIETPNNTKSL